MSFKVIQQLVIISVAIGLVFLYIQPQLEVIQLKQNEVAQYTDAVNQANAFNQELNSKLNQINSISSVDFARVDRFLPFSIDSVAVARDIESLARRNDLIVNTITTQAIESNVSVNRIQEDEFDEFGELINDSATNRNLAGQLTGMQFTLQAVGTYDTFVSFLAATEANAYPLEIINLTVSSPNSDGTESVPSDTNASLTYDITFAVHAVATSLE